MPITRSRAAVICFGGWGLQVLLHLWPRLHGVQNERDLLALEGLPSLKDLTAFAAVMPVPNDPAFSSGPIRVVQPGPDNCPKPFFVDQRIGEILQANVADMAAGRYLTHGEQLGYQLFSAAKNNQQGWELKDIPLKSPRIATPMPTGVPSRLDMFNCALEWAEPISRALLRNAIDPTRLDGVQTRDPLVQTSIYVVASLAEPLASALIWPIVSELAALLADRNIAKVIGIFLTGSFATDDSRVLEEANVHVSMRELNGFLGLADGDTHDTLREMLRRHGKDAWAPRVAPARRLFDRLYLVDREKQNQALARDALELAVLSSNAIESFLIADGAGYVENQIGPDLTATSVPPYSLLGAANDYVPLASYVDSAIREEQKRIVRSSFLLESPPEPPAVSLRDLGMAPEDVEKRLLEFGRQHMFGPVPAAARLRRALRRVRSLVSREQDARPASPDVHEILADLRIAREYILPQDVVRYLFQVGPMWQWRTAIQQRVRTLAANLEEDLGVTQAEASWGSLYYSLNPPSEGITIALQRFRTKTWARRTSEDRRTLPSAVFRALEIAVKDVCAQPSGLCVARSRLDQWISQAEIVLAVQQQREPFAAEAAWQERYGRAFRAWEQHFVRLSASRPHRAASWTRAIALGALVTYALSAWVVYQAPPGISVQFLAAGAAACAAVTGLLGLGPELIYRWRMHNTQEQRVHLAEDQLSHLALNIARQGFSQVYRRLVEDLSTLRQQLDESTRDLEDWSKPEEPVEIPPPDVQPTHLRREHKTDQIWQMIKDLVQREAPAGATSAQRLYSTWTRDGNAPADWKEVGDRLPQRVRLALELPLNQRDQACAETLRKRQRASAQVAAQPNEGEEHAPAGTGALATPTSPRGEPEPRQTKREDVEECCFVSLPEDEESPAHCTACPRPDYSCAMTPEGHKARRAWSLAGLVLEYVQQATLHLHPWRRTGEARQSFLREIVENYTLDSLLLAGSDTDQEGDRTALLFDFAEDIYARAKLSANYELHNPFMQQGFPVEFAVTAQGSESILHRAMRQRTTASLSSQDPMSLSVVRTLNCIFLQDLGFTERTKLEYDRLAETDVRQIVLLRDKVWREVVYGQRQSDAVRYDPILPILPEHEADA